MKNAMSTNTARKLLNLGALVAIFLGIVTAIGPAWGANASPWLLLVLMIIGLIAGFYSYGEKDSQQFLLAVVGLILAIAVSSIMTLDKIVPKLGTFVQATLGNFVIVLGVAAIIVSIRAIYGLQK